MAEVDPNLAMFATWSRQEEERERAAKRSAKKIRDEERKAQELVRAKDTAAAELKRVRSDSRATPEQKAAADTAYREALAAVVSAETGSTPEWAPPAADPDAEPVGETGPDPEPTGEAEADAEVAPDGRTEPRPDSHAAAEVGDSDTPFDSTTTDAAGSA